MYYGQYIATLYESSGIKLFLSEVSIICLTYMCTDILRDKLAAVEQHVRRSSESSDREAGVCSTEVQLARMAMVLYMYSIIMV